jgi:hypothetical protein
MRIDPNLCHAPLRLAVLALARIISHPEMAVQESPRQR